ncbi:MAG: ABC transporter ATP-binding protein [Candidatus Fermentibacteraceae bacterium]|nr:ABC transporter ATP-binding protein [Candidatus Fermentibacteraceae bacterium]
MNRNVVLSAENIHCSYGSADASIKVIKGTSIEIRAGEVVAVTGPSGSGKSTLLHALGLLEKPDLGKVFICGEDGWALSGSRRAALRNRKIGFVFQFHHLLEEFTLKENVMMPCLIAGVRTEEASDSAGKLLERVGILHRASHFPSQVSGGERQRAAVARAIVMKPQIVLADEPTGNLDTETSREVERLIMELAEEGQRSFLLATHSLDLASAVHRRLFLNSGVLTEGE